jgi:choloylglycine hydrolase
MKRNWKIGMGAVLSMAMAAPHVAKACSRAVYVGEDGQTVTGRTMDWFISDMDTNMWLYPRGLERNSNTANQLVWTSKYGSVVTTVYEGVATDGMNEAGLVANMLYLVEGDYPPAVEGDTRPTLPITAWAQYVLDNIATTAEADEALRKSSAW